MDRTLTRSRNGVTLLEMLIVITLISLMAGVTYPAVSAGVDSLRLRSAADAIALSMNAALNRAQRRQQPVEFWISRSRNTVLLRASEPLWQREIGMPTGVAILRILPEEGFPEAADRRFLALPGATAPPIGVVIGNRRGARKLVRVDPITGSTQIEDAP